MGERGELGLSGDDLVGRGGDGGGKKSGSKSSDEGLKRVESMIGSEVVDGEGVGDGRSARREKKKKEGRRFSLRTKGRRKGKKRGGRRGLRSKEGRRELTCKRAPPIHLVAPEELARASHWLE